MIKLIEVTSANHDEKYIINANDIIYIEEIYNNKSKSMIYYRNDLPICKIEGISDPNCLYLSDSYDELKKKLL